MPIVVFISTSLNICTSCSCTCQMILMKYLPKGSKNGTAVSKSEGIELVLKLHMACWSVYRSFSNKCNARVLFLALAKAVKTKKRQTRVKTKKKTERAAKTKKKAENVILIVNPECGTFCYEAVPSISETVLFQPELRFSWCCTSNRLGRWLILLFLWWETVLLTQSMA